MNNGALRAIGRRALPLGEIAKLYQPRTVSGRELTPHGYPVYGANGQIGYYPRFNHKESQIAVTCRGNTCGRVNFTPPQSWITGNAMVVNVDGRHDIDKRFLFHYLNAQDLTGLITGSGQPQIVRGPLARLIIVVPALTEQRRIAEVADDLDHLITRLERLIAKKQAIKQGMMQQLLTGRTRLPGFTVPWSERTLGEVARIKTGSRNNQDKRSGGRYPFFVRSATVERIDTYSHDCEAILVPGEGGIGSIFHYINGRFEVHQRVYKISDFTKDTRGRFVYHYMRHYFGAHAMENSVKATVDSLRLPTFRQFRLNLPKLDEQDAIMGALDNAEDEIQTLKKRLAKARDVKTGMMQELLTGRTRLPVEEVAA